MNIKIVHMKRSGLTVSKDQLFDLSRSSKKYVLLSNEFTHLPLHKTKAKYKVETVEEAISEYDNLLYTRLLKEVDKPDNNAPYRTMLRSLYSSFKQLIINNKTMYLGCWCKDELDPKYYDHGCHCDVVKDLLMKKWKKENGTN